MRRRGFLIKGFGSAIGGALIGLGATAKEEHRNPSQNLMTLKTRFNNNLKFGIFSGVYAWMLHKSFNKKDLTQNDLEL